MIRIGDLADTVHHARAGRRHLLLFSFYCDESYDGNPKGNQKKTKGGKPHEPRTYVVGGWFARPQVWRRVEALWNAKNVRCMVPRYHAAHLNAATYEFDGWSKNKRLRYSRDMLRILKDQKQKLHAVSIGIKADEYRSIISDEGREKLGHPYLVCFKTCIAVIAIGMAGFPPEDKFSVVFDRNEFSTEIVRLFYGQKDNPACPYRHRLATCTPGDSEEIAALQTADLLAYETFRAMHDERENKFNYRHALRSMFPHNAFNGFFYESQIMTRMQEDIHGIPCGPNGLWLNPPHAEVNTEI